MGDVKSADVLTNGCNSIRVWGTTTYINDSDRFRPQYSKPVTRGSTGFLRGSYYIDNITRKFFDLKYGPLTKQSQITDGTSKTTMVAEKRMRSDLLGEDLPYDDRGWSDGVGHRHTQVHDLPAAARRRRGAPRPGDKLTSGSRTPAAKCVVRRRVAFIDFNVDLETWNRLAHKSDGELSPP
jgi:hypothetical protein